MTARRVAVIGAGLAGLACAERLQRTGLAVSVFDKSRAAGGRMSTRRRDDWQCDHGAQYFTARHPAFVAEVARWQQAGVAAVWQPRLQVFGTAPAAANIAADATVVRHVGVPRMTSPARLLAGNLDLTTQATIEEIRRDGSGWVLRSTERGWLATAFDAVVLAIPAAQAQPLLRDVAPALRDLAAGVRLRGCWTLMLHFTAPVPLAFDAAFVNDGPLRWLARNNSKPGRSGAETWVLQASAEWSEAHLEEHGEQIAAALLPAFAALGGPTPEAWSGHRWRYADSDNNLNIGSAWDDGLQLGLCADWLHGGRVEGAWLSGRDLAQRILGDLAAT